MTALVRALAGIGGGGAGGIGIGGGDWTPRLRLIAWDARPRDAVTDGAVLVQQLLCKR